MKVLVVGGTGFLGGAITDAAVASGHDTHVLTRQTLPRNPRGVSYITGERHGDLAALRGQRFDIVFDTCAFAPDAVDALLSALSPDIGHYAFVSSISAYASYATPRLDETAALHEPSAEHLALARAMPLAQRSQAASYGPAYGPLKVACERAAVARLGDRVSIHRAGLLVGPKDYTDRLTWWVRRIDQGGPIPAPGRPERLVQLIDARDAGAFIVAQAASGAGGVFNLTGRTFPFETLLSACRDMSNSNATFHWRSDDDVLAAGLAPWSETPVWLPEKDPDWRNFLNVGTDRAFAAGLTTRPLAQTLADILLWDRGRRDVALRAGMPPEKEAALLAR